MPDIVIPALVAFLGPLVALGIVVMSRLTDHTLDITTGPSDVASSARPRTHINASTTGSETTDG